MTTLQQQQNEARVEFRKSAGVVYSENSLGPILDKVIARTREQTLKEVEAGIEAMKFDSPMGEEYVYNQAYDEAKEIVAAHLRTLREGITGNEPAK